MSSVELITYKDILDHLNDWQSANPDARTTRFARRAIHYAMRDLAKAHHWTYLQKQDFIRTVAPYETGTIAYDHTGGTYERMATLTDGTWPDDAADRTLRVSNVDYTVAEKKTDSIITLDIRRNPGSDIAAGTSYSLYQDRYVLPADCWTIDQLFPENIGVCPDFVHPREWLAKTRFANTSSSYPSLITVMGSDDYQGAMEVVLFPHPDSAVTHAFIYSRRLRRVSIEDYKTGTVSTSANSTTLSGSGTAFTDLMVGALVRLSANSNEYPTDRSGANPYVVERSVLGVTDGTTIELDQAVSTAYSGVKFVISDPIDIDVQVMGSAFLRLCEAHLGRMLRLEDRKALHDEYRMALMEAKEADVRSTAPRAVGVSTGRLRLRDMPLGADVE